MATFTTPGVYIQEISTLPSSVVAVPTAVPVFIGYTKQAILGGQTLTTPTNPVRVTSMLEFQSIFGGAYSESFTVALTGPNVDIDPALVVVSGTDFRLFYHMQMYFANGGGPCYIISVGDIDTDTISANDLQTAIDLADQIDEITLIVIPEAVSSAITDAERKGIYDAMAANCARMKDRFAVVDVLARGISIADDADKFRNLNIGANNLSYAAAYYPPFTPTLSFSYVDTDVTINASNLGLPLSVQAFNTETLDVVNNGITGAETLTFLGTYTFSVSSGDFLVINGVNVSLEYADFTAFSIAIAADPNVTSIVNVVTNIVNETAAFTTVVPGPLTIAITIGAGSIATSGSITGIAPDKVLYSRIKTSLTNYPITLYPSAMMAGIYASVDNDRGVWKAPANVGVTLVSSLNVNVKDADQGGLNVDPVSGKSIDVIRRFDGRGILVWGARTLDGNNNEWRYIPVRRLFLMVEDSCKHASEFVVFEPNDKNTWVRVKGMISNFLTSLWRDGALAGDKPEQAFFVKVGLNETMTAQDILDGKMIVQIGMAAVRPAEFIILQFEHKLQEA